jgi:hypothetical protein
MQVCDAVRTQGFAPPVDGKSSPNGESNEGGRYGTRNRKVGVDIWKVGYRLSVDDIQYAPRHRDTADSKDQGTDAKDWSQSQYSLLLALRVCHCDK